MLKAALFWSDRKISKCLLHTSEIKDGCCEACLTLAGNQVLKRPPQDVFGRIEDASRLKFVHFCSLTCAEAEKSPGVINIHVNGTSF
jgi:hypothetical protein